MWSRRLCLGYFTKYNCEPLSRAVHDLREHCAQCRKRRNCRDLLHRRLSDDLPFENTSEDHELACAERGRGIAKLLPELMDQAGRYSLISAAVCDRHFAFEWKVIMFISKRVECAPNKRLFRDRITDSISAKCAT